MEAQFIPNILSPKLAEIIRKLKSYEFFGEAPPSLGVENRETPIFDP